MSAVTVTLTVDASMVAGDCENSTPTLCCPVWPDADAAPHVIAMLYTPAIRARTLSIEKKSVMSRTSARSLARISTLPLKL
jgi:hypothetical protein